MVCLVALVAVLLLSVGVAAVKHMMIQSTLIPNERESLDDCGQRYAYLSPEAVAAPVSNVFGYWREFAHLGAIGWTRDDGSVYWGCGGSLIWENFVLTAAHCVFHPDFNNSQPAVVRFGDLNLYDETDDQFVQQYNIVKIIRHPEHRFSAKYHDIALLILEKNIE